MIAIGEAPLCQASLVSRQVRVQGQAPRVANAGDHGLHMIWVASECKERSLVDPPLVKRKRGAALFSMGYASLILLRHKLLKSGIIQHIIPSPSIARRKTRVNAHMPRQPLRSPQSGGGQGGRGPAGQTRG